mgnify:CR=1 FL=1
MSWKYRNCPAAVNVAVPMNVKVWLPAAAGVGVDRIDVDHVAPATPRPGSR